MLRQRACSPRLPCCASGSDVEHRHYAALSESISESPSSLRLPRRSLAQSDQGRSLRPHCSRWHRETVFAFPPLPLLARTLTKARADGIRRVFVVPFTLSHPTWQVLAAASQTHTDGTAPTRPCKPLGPAQHECGSGPFAPSSRGPARPFPYQLPCLTPALARRACHALGGNPIRRPLGLTMAWIYSEGARWPTSSRGRPSAGSVRARTRSPTRQRTVGVRPSTNSPQRRKTPPAQRYTRLGHRSGRGARAATASRPS
jgi:hypothetical protein